MKIKTIIKQARIKTIKPEREHILKRMEHRERAVKEYVELEAEGEKVIHLEMVKTEAVGSNKMDAWDVHTDCNRWWVITNPTNLYLQKQFPSLDYTLSFHVGLMVRVNSLRSPPTKDGQKKRLSTTWRLWVQTAEYFDQAEEVEELQAVGMRCRECLVDLSKNIYTEFKKEAKNEPKAADFVSWSEELICLVYSGSKFKHLRTYLLGMTKEVWEMVNWLTHAKEVTRLEVDIAVDAVSEVISVLGTIIINYENNPPEKCPNCSSRHIATDYRPDLEIDPPYVTLCESCSWNNEKDKLAIP